MQSHHQHGNVMFVVLAVKRFNINLENVPLWKSRHSGCRQEQWDLICDITLWLECCRNGKFVSVRRNVGHKRWNLHVKRDIIEMHKKHIAFPFLFCVWHHSKASSSSARLFPSFQLLNMSASLKVNGCGSSKGCMVQLGGKVALTARQSMVKVDVAQVFWRPFWQTYFVVIVDHPPTDQKNVGDKLKCFWGNKFQFSLKKLVSVWLTVRLLKANSQNMQFSTTL